MGKEQISILMKINLMQLVEKYLNLRGANEQAIKVKDLKWNFEENNFTFFIAG